jgi:hypothetical protein
MAIRLLAPADPVPVGRSVLVRARCEPPAARLWWEWDDGGTDLVEFGGGAGRPQRAHQYAARGVYRVRVREAPEALPDDEIRFVAVRASGELAGSGWISGAGTRTPFAFLLAPPDDEGVSRADVRCLVEGVELHGHGPAWQLAVGPGELHFGGTARLGDGDDLHPYRVDLRVDETNRRTQLLTLTAYAPGGRPGWDSPLVRLAGRIRPGRAILSTPHLTEARP